MPTFEVIERSEGDKVVRQGTLITYDHYLKFPGVKRAPELLRSVVEEYHPARIFEIGSGANPTMEIAEVRARGLHYTTSDISEDELRKAPPGYETRRLNAETLDLPMDLSEAYDLVFSRMVNEHLRNGRQYHENVFKMLRPGGIALHCCPTLFTLPFVINYVLPESVSGLLLHIVSPRHDYEHHGKFPAYYSWCRGPTSKMIRNFSGLGFEVLLYHAYFGHAYYERMFPILNRLEEVKTRFLLQHPHPALTSFATVLLRKPRSSS